MSNNEENEKIVLTNFIDLPNSGKRALLITINRPNQLNAFNTHVCHTLATIFGSIADSSHKAASFLGSEKDGGDGQGEEEDCSDIAAIIFTGKGTSFCAGADLSNPPDPLKQASDLHHDLRCNPVHQMDRLCIPIIGAIRGHCVTGGFELALACDILIGDQTTKFRDTHVKFGIAPCWGLSQKLQRKIGSGRASLVSFSATSVDATRAFQWGLLDDLVTEERGVGDDDDDGNEDVLASAVVKCAIEIADKIGMNDDTMVQRYKRVMKEGGKMDLEKGMKRERELGMAHYRAVVDDGKTIEGARDFITDERRPRSKL